MRVTSPVSLFVVFSLVTACGGAAPGSPPGTGGSCGQQKGVTDCRGVSCQAGNYCSNNFYISNYCQPGCTSDANCGAGDFCARCAGESLGVCQRCGVAASCGQGSHCKQSNTASQTCTGDGQGSSGYDCTDSDRPVGQCDQSRTFATVFCCGAAQTPTCTANPSSNMCDNAFAQLMGRPGDYTHPYSCAGTATPAGTCKHLVGETWCCN